METKKQAATRQSFARKEQNLLNALDRVKKLIEEKYLPILLAHKYPQVWPFTWDFNLLHDLQYRLECRLRDLQSDFFDWHFQAHGWVAMG